MKSLVLSERMKAITSLVTEGNTVCDVGCDHGYVSIYLVMYKQAPKAVAMDVRMGPLSLAKEHIAEYGLSEKIDTRCSDGLEKVEAGETQTCIIAGMGGVLMAKILKDGEEKAHSFQELILQPQSHIQEFRAFLREEGYTIIEEDMVLEEGKYYPMMKVVPKRAEQEKNTSFKQSKASEYLNLWDLYGQHLLEKQHPVLKSYLLKTQKANAELLEHLEAQASEKSEARRRDLEEEQKGLNKVLSEYFDCH